jgi:N-acetylmuramoyl-L-alanine amidase
MPLRTPDKEDNLHGEPEADPLFPINSEASQLNETLGLNNSGYDENNPASKASKKAAGGERSEQTKADDPRQIEQKEKTGGGPVTGRAARAESNLIGKGFNVADNALPPQVRALNSVRKLFTQRRGQAAGGIAGTIALLVGGYVFISGTNYELTLVRQQAMKETNKLAAEATDERHINSFGMTARLLKNGKLTDRFKMDKLAEKFRAKGFIIELSEDKTKLTKLAYESRDNHGKLIGTREYDFSKPSLQAGRDFFGAGEDGLGREISLKFGTITGGNALTFKGRVAVKVMSRLGIKYNNWLKDHPSDKAKTRRGKFASVLRQAELDDSPTSSLGRAPPAGDDQDPRATDANGNPTNKDANGRDVGVSDDPAKDSSDAQAQKQAILDTPDDPVSKITGQDGVNLTSAFEKLRAQRLSADQALTKIGDSISPALKSSIGRSLQVSSVEYYACRLKGALAFVQNTRNVLLAYKMAKFAALFMSAADHEKASLIDGDGRQLFMEYLHEKDPETGKSYTQSGGFQSVVMGDKEAVPKEANLSKYSTGRKDNGTIGALNAAANGALIGAVVGTAACKFVNNKFVQIGSTIIGGALALFTAGTSAIASAAASFGLAVSAEMAISFSTAMLIGATTGVVLDGISESGEDAGDGLASSMGGWFGLNNQANGLRPITKAKAQALAMAADQAQKEEIANSSLFDRYLNVANVDSAAGHLALDMPSSPLSLPLNTFSIALSSLNPLSMFGKLHFGSDKVYAAENSCPDEEVVKRGIEADIFCNVTFADTPVVRDAHDDSKPDDQKIDLEKVQEALTSNGDIDGDSLEIKSDDFQGYVDNCFSGRAGILYENTTGTTEKEQAKIDHKIQTGQLDPSKPDDTCTTSGPTSANGHDYKYGQYDMYAAWYGYLVDLDNDTDWINDTVPVAAGSAAPAATTTGSGDGKTIILDPGHSPFNDESSRDPLTGLYDVETSGGPGEAHGAWVAADKIKKELDAKGYTVKITKNDENESISLGERAKRANNFNGALLFTIHADSNVRWLAYPDKNSTRVPNGSTRKDGTDGLVHPEIEGPSKAFAEKMAPIIASHISSSGDAYDATSFADYYGSAGIPGNGKNSGNTPVQTILSSVPEVYSEVSPTDLTSQGFVDGAVAAIEAAVPLSGDAAVDPTNLREDSSSVPCAEGTNDLGTQDGYTEVGGEVKKVSIKVCAVSNIQQRTPVSVQGANGHVVVNSRVSGAFYKLAEAAQKDHIDVTAVSSFRTMSEQEEQCRQNSYCRNGDYRFVAKPGTSNHQLGMAIDFYHNGKGNDADNCDGGRGSDPCTLRGDPTWEWLKDNAGKFGMKQYSKEFWHWSPLEN